MVLCVDQRAARYLITPINAGYLNLMEIVEISNEHKVEQKATFNFKDITLLTKSDDAKNQTLYDYMVYMKLKLNCHFEFQINGNNDVVFGARMPNKNLVDVVLIKCARFNGDDSRKMGTMEFASATADG